MQDLSFQTWGRRVAAALACVVLFLSLPQYSRAWGKNGHRLVVHKAVETLPQDIRPFFESNLALLAQHVTDPLDAIAKSPLERHNHFVLLDNGHPQGNQTHGRLWPFHREFLLTACISRLACFCYGT